MTCLQLRTHDQVSTYERCQLTGGVRKDYLGNHIDLCISRKKKHTHPMEGHRKFPGGDLKSQKF